MKKISARQLIIFYFIYSFAIKFLMLPSLLADSAGRDCWVAAGVGALIELALLWIVVCVMSADRDQDVYDALRFRKSGIMSAAFAKIILAVMFLFFLLQTLITMAHAKSLLETSLYENLNKHLFVIPLLVLGVFFCYSKTRAVFRSGEIFYILILLAIFLAVLPAFWKIDLREELPVLAGGLKSVFRAIYNSLIYFEGAAVILMFKGEVEIGKAFKRKFILTAVIGAAAFTAFVFFFYALFGPLAISRTLGIVDVTGNNSYIAQNGRLEWVIACVWLLLLLMRFGVLFYCCFASARFVTHIRFQPAALAFPLAAVIYALFYFITRLDRIIMRLRPVTLGFYILIPLLFILALLLISQKARIETKEMSAAQNSGNNNAVKTAGESDSPESKSVASIGDKAVPKSKFAAVKGGKNV